MWRAPGFGPAPFGPVVVPDNYNSVHCWHEADITVRRPRVCFWPKADMLEHAIWVYLCCGANWSLRVNARATR